MFDFSLAVQLFQGSAQRTWNCFTEFTNLVWYKLNHRRHPVMPRSRRRHHSRSRSRTRSHSHDRDRDAKRRKIDSIESPTHKRSVSCEEMNIPDKQQQHEDTIIDNSNKTEDIIEEDNHNNTIDNKEINDSISSITSNETTNQNNTTPRSKKINEERERERNERKLQKQAEREKLRLEKEREKQDKIEQKRREREEKEEQKRKEREEKEQKRKEREEKEEQKRKEREEKEEQKRKEREEKDELKRKEKEEKEQKRKEKEEREMQKRKEREQEKLRKQQELDEKNKEKQKLEEQKQKAAAAFVNFFVTKKTEINDEKKQPDNNPITTTTSSIFMPFQIKSDMRLPPKRRPQLTQIEKDNLDEFLLNPNNDKYSYLLDLKKNGKSIGKSLKTWPYEDPSDDVCIIEDDLGETICEDKRKCTRMRVKFLKFDENRRPPYYGTWRKKSSIIKPRKPFVEDKEYFDYEIESDEEWEEEEEQGESLNGSDNEDKDNDNENDNDDYEVDNEFFVPHGHLSDDEIDDEINSKLSPTALKEKLKLLKDEFEEDMKTQTQKIKPRSIGCIWYNKNGDNRIETIDRYLSPFAMLTNGQIIVKKRQLSVVSNNNNNNSNSKTLKKSNKEMKEELIPVFLKFIDQNPNKKKKLIGDFVVHMQNNGYNDELTRNVIEKHLKMFAEWKKCREKGPLFNKYIWSVYDDVKEKYESVSNLK